MILGIDEVGRGPWAGPLVVGAVVLGDAKIDGLTDSKKLSAKRRSQLDTLIREQAAGFGLGWVHAEELDQLIIDGTINFLQETSKGTYVTTLAKADLLIPSVSAASIIAKVARDSYMAEQDSIYPGYGFSKHVGYGTALHRAAIDEKGVTPLHRTSFAPIAKILGLQPKSKMSKLFSHPDTTKKIGDEGERQAEEYLVSLGHTVIDRNWKTKWCEIDIVSILNDEVYFSEVKYRKNAESGDGFEAVTKTKQRQMAFAAEYYLAKHPKIATNPRLAAISITNSELQYLELE